MSSRAALLALLVAVLSPRQADACRCATPAAKVWPDMRTSAPINTHVFIRLPAVMSGKEPAKPELFTLEQRAEPKKATKPARKKKGKKAPAPEPEAPPIVPLDLTRKVYDSADTVVVELLPGRSLEPGKRYDVLYDGVMVSTFMTGTAADDEVPALPAGEGRFYRPSDRYSSCATGDAFARVRVAPADTDAAAGLYSVWVAKPGGKLDYAQPATAIVEAAAGELSLGHESACRSPNVAWPARGRVRVGVRALDLAGNQSPPLEVELDLDKPIHKPPP